MNATGSAVVASNDLVLEANDLPLNSRCPKWTGRSY